MRGILFGNQNGAGRRGLDGTLCSCELGPEPSSFALKFRDAKLSDDEILGSGLKKQLRCAELLLYQSFGSLFLRELLSQELDTIGLRIKEGLLECFSRLETSDTSPFEGAIFSSTVTDVVGFAQCVTRTWSSRVPWIGS